MTANTSIWEDSILEHCDVAIVGGGFLGMWTAYHLKKKSPHLNIHIYERDVFGIGASTRNAGFSCFGTVGEFLSDSQTSSTKQALSCVIDRYLGLQEILNLAREYRLDIGYEPTGGFELLKPSEVLSVKEGLDNFNDVLLKELNLSNTFSIQELSKTNLPFNTQTFSHVVTNPFEGGVNSAKLLWALKVINESLGVKIFHGIEVFHIDKNILSLKNHYREFEVHAQTVVLALNSFVDKFSPGSVVPARGQIIWCDNLNLDFKGTYHFDEGFYYFRTIGEDQLLIGGARNLDIETEHTHEFSGNVDIQQHLLNFVHNELNIKNFEIKKRWQGIMGFTKDKQPIIKELSPNLWHLHACNGMGVALTPMISKRFAREI